MYIYLEENPAVFNGAYSQVIVPSIAALVIASKVLKSCSPWETITFKSMKCDLWIQYLRAAA